MDASRNQLDFNFAADDLLELPRDIGETGWFQFQSERRQALRELESRFGVPLNKPVRVRLHGEDEELEGRLMPESLLLPGPEDENLLLRLGERVIRHTEIESVQLAG